MIISILVPKIPLSQSRAYIAVNRVQKRMIWDIPAARKAPPGLIKAIRSIYYENSNYVKQKVRNF